MKPLPERLKLSKKYRKELILKETFYEHVFRSYLKGVKYERQKVIFTNEWEFFIVDFYIPKYKLVIEIDGKQHKENKEYDKYRTEKLKSVGVRKVLRFTNKDIKTMSPKRIREILIVNMIA